MFVSIRYMEIKSNTLAHNTCSQVYHLLTINVGVSLLHGLIVAKIRINKIYTQIDKVKVKPYLHQNHSIGYISLFVDCFHLQEQPNSSQCHILYLDLFCLCDNGI